ncbi:MAG TPA: aminopeptidase P family N-terminal domain-containing protein, partial [Methylomirabilota bacterium]|nr:aminopeptidase P family N-terminal domain-containing protein [Methylomirabilota bacterium]
MPELPHASELATPDRDGIDFPKLRAGRLARLQTMMKRYDLPVALLYNTANIRYATGADVMAVWTAGTFARYCLVPAEGAPVLFEYKGSVHVSQKVVGDVRPAYTWQYGGLAARDKAREWAQSIRSALRELGLEHERLAVDKLDATGFLALQDEKIPIVEVLPATVDAREVKTPEEVQLFEINGKIGDAILAEFEAAIRPGIREYELLAVLSDALIRRHGEALFTRLVSSGTNTNPWLTEATDRVVMPG